MTISDVNGSTFRRLIRYIYTGCLVSTDDNPLGMDHLLDLLILSDRFEVESLKEKCQGRLKEWINEKSVLGLLCIADQYTAGNLRVRYTYVMCCAYIDNFSTTIYFFFGDLLMLDHFDSIFEDPNLIV